MSRHTAIILCFWMGLMLIGYFFGGNPFEQRYKDLARAILRKDDK